MNIYRSLLLIISLILFPVSAVNSECIQGNCQNGYGIWHYEDGSRYEGEWNNGSYSGNGKLTRPGAVKLESPQDPPGEWWGKGATHKEAFRTVQSSNEINAEKSASTLPIQAAEKPPLSNKTSPQTTIKKDISIDSHKEDSAGSKPPQGFFSFLKWPVAQKTKQPVSLEEKRPQKSARIIKKKTTVSFSDTRQGVCLQGDCFDGEGTWKYSNGSTYTGQWKNGQYHGRGTLNHPDGRSITREFKNGEAAW